ncbi:MAG: flagellar basal body P-ring formation protein FlgA [Steroidobacteraceae bacterium]|nr:flagellar basal body P-ring formation protein FlgA [Steroidobacteraceae bacterium]
MHLFLTTLPFVSTLPAAAQAPAEPVMPGAVQSLERLTRRAEAAVREALPTPADAAGARPVRALRIVARPLDPRLRLAACGGPLEAEAATPPGGLGARAVVTVRCAGPTRWAVLVPVTIETEATVLVARRPLPRGARPGPDDVEVVKQTLPGIANTYISNVEMLEGLHLARPVAPGTPLSRAMLAADPVVRRGESVTLVARQGGMEIRAPGRALADAAPGARVRVQNVNSLKVVEGRADDSGMIRVDP